MRKRNRGQKRKQGERGGGGGVVTGRDRVLENKNEYSKYSMEATGASFISRMIRRK